MNPMSSGVVRWTWVAFRPPSSRQSTQNSKNEPKAFCGSGRSHATGQPMAPTVRRPLHDVQQPDQSTEHLENMQAKSTGSASASEDLIEACQRRIELPFPEGRLGLGHEV